MAQGEVYLKANLTADSWAGDVGAAEKSEGESHAAVELVLATGKALKLVFTEAIVVIDSAIGLNAERDTRVEVMKQRYTPGVDVAAGGLNADHTGAGVAGEKEAEVSVEPGLFRERFLRDGVEPVIGEAGTKLLAGVAGWKFNVEAGREGGNAHGVSLLVEVPFDAHVGIAASARGFGSGSAIDGEIWDIEIELETVGQAVVDL